MQRLFLLIIIFSSCSSPKIISKGPDIDSANDLPIVITYIKPLPADDTKQFMERLIQEKGIKIISIKEALELAHDKRINLLQQGGANETTFNKVGEIKVALQMRMKVHQNSSAIDSIEWKIFNMPASDTGRYYTKYYPRKDTARNIRTDIRDFVNSIFTETKKS